MEWAPVGYFTYGTFAGRKSESVLQKSEWQKTVDPRLKAVEIWPLNPSQKSSFRFNENCLIFRQTTFTGHKIILKTYAQRLIFIFWDTYFKCSHHGQFL